MAVDESKFIPLFNYRNIYLALEAQAGQHPPKILNHDIAQHTGFATDTVTLEINGAQKNIMYSGPTLLGLGPKVAELERLRLMELQRHINRSLKEIDAFLNVVRG